MYACESTEPWFRSLFCVKHVCTAQGYLKTQPSGVPRQTMARQRPRASIASDAGLPELFEILKDRGRVTVEFSDASRAVLTPADLECLPVRMWLFGLISCFERCLLEMVRRRCSEADFAQVLSNNRLQAARRLYRGRIGRHERLDLAACLQIADKRELLLAERGAARQFGFESMNQAKKFFEHVETLRDRLVHAHELVVTSAADELIAVTLQLLKFLNECCPADPE